MTEDQTPLPEFELDDETEFVEELPSAYRPGVDMCLVWSATAMDHWGWLWRALYGNKVGVKVLVAGKEAWHASKYSTINGSRAVPRRELSIAVNPEAHYDDDEHETLMTVPWPSRSVWRQKIAIVVGCVAICCVIWVGIFPLPGPDLMLLLGIVQGLFVALWLCGFYSWRIHGPVSYAKFCLQMRAPWVQTPGQLYAAVKRRNDREAWIE